VRQLANIQKYPTLRVAITLVTEFRPPGPERDECDTSLHAAIIDETTCTGSECQGSFWPDHYYVP
jgi:hypothetical protein